VRGMAPGLLLASGALCGCSLFLTQYTALPVSPTEPVRCSESRAAPIADTVFAASFTAATVALVVHGATRPHSTGVDCASCYDYLLAAMSAGFALGAGVVAKVGYDRTSDCQRIHDRQRRCVAGDRDACATIQAPTQ
jgi:hypothetical protein